MKFLDEAKIFVKAGRGGNGCISFHREKFVEFGGPDGGNGGRGGHIYVEVVNNLNTLIDFRYQQHFKAPRGQDGMGRQRSGKSGKDLTIKVPVGTQIIAEDKKTVLYDLTKEGEIITLATGGNGGVGNEFFKSATNQAPRKATPGKEGEEIWVWLRLKLIANVGLVGLPNAGKSTFLSSVTKARPKVADYPFTTLHPNLGVVYLHGNSYVIADIPGLIEGAHQGSGLGHRFLGHVERCSVILHLIDVLEDDIQKAYLTIREELKAYDETVAAKPFVIGLTKCDTLDEEMIQDRIQELKEVTGEVDIYPISSVAQQGTKPLLEHLQRFVEADKLKEISEEEAEYSPLDDESAQPSAV